MQKTLLDEFAIAALSTSAGSGMAPEAIASRAFDIATAMMAERAKRLPAEKSPVESHSNGEADPRKSALQVATGALLMQAIQSLKGRKVTCSEICQKAYNWQGDMTALREIGATLRSMGFQKVRSGGKDYYQL